MVRSENILTLQFPLMKGKLILCEIPPGHEVRAGAIIWVLEPCSPSTWGRRKLRGGDPQRDAGSGFAGGEGGGPE